MPSGHAAVPRGSQAGGVATETPLGLNVGARMRHPCLPGADDLRIIALHRERMQMRIWSRPGPDLVSTRNGTFRQRHGPTLHAKVCGAWCLVLEVSKRRPPSRPGDQCRVLALAYLTGQSEGVNKESWCGSESSAAVTTPRSTGASAPRTTLTPLGGVELVSAWFLPRELSWSVPSSFPALDCAPCS